MTTRPETSDTPEAHAQHLKAWNRIPWLVAGSASAAEAAAFEQHAQRCEACRTELQFQRQLHAAMHASAAPAHSPEPALQRLQARIAIEDSVAPLASPPSWRTASGRAGARSPGWTRAWAGVALLQAAGLVLLGSMLWSRSDGDLYRTLTTAPTAAAARPATVRLVLSPQMTAGQWQALLKRHGLAAVEISADGASLGVTAVDAAALAAAPDALLGALRAEPGVMLAEPIVARPR